MITVTLTCFSGTELHRYSTEGQSLLEAAWAGRSEIKEPDPIIISAECAESNMRWTHLGMRCHGLTYPPATSAAEGHSENEPWRSRDVQITRDGKKLGGTWAHDTQAMEALRNHIMGELAERDAWLFARVARPGESIGDYTGTV